MAGHIPVQLEHDSKKAAPEIAGTAGELYRLLFGIAPAFTDIYPCCRIGIPLELIH